MAGTVGEKGEAQRIAIGTKIRKLRAKRQMTMEQVAVRAGCSRAFLSRVERDESLPSVATLVGIARALGVSPGYFFEVTDAERSVVLRKDERSRIEDQGVMAELVTRDIPTRKMQMTSITIPPGKETSGRRHKYDDDQCGVCLEGSVRVLTEHSLFEVSSGDSFYFNSPIPYSIRNAGNGPAVVLVVSARRSF